MRLIIIILIICSGANAQSIDYSIGYYHQDSLRTMWIEYRKFDSSASDMMNQYTSTVDRKNEELENFKRRIAYSDSAGLLSQNEQKESKERILEMMTDLQDFQAENAFKLEAEIKEMTSELLKELKKFTEAYCLKNNIDVLMSISDAAPWNYVSENVELKNYTKDFIAYLNSN